MSFDGGRKPEHPEETHANTRRTCKLHTERTWVGPWIRTQDLLAVRQQCIIIIITPTGQRVWIESLKLRFSCCLIITKHVLISNDWTYFMIFGIWFLQPFVFYWYCVILNGCLNVRVRLTNQLVTCWIIDNISNILFEIMWRTCEFVFMLLI